MYVLIFSVSLSLSLFYYIIVRSNVNNLEIEFLLFVGWDTIFGRKIIRNWFHFFFFFEKC